MQATPSIVGDDADKILIAGFDTPAPRGSMEKWKSRDSMRTSQVRIELGRHKAGEFPTPSVHSSHEVLREEVL